MTPRRFTFAASLVVVVLTGCGDDGGDGGAALPDIMLGSLAPGDPSLDLGELRGPAVINLWATWCAPCRRELPAFQHVSDQRADIRFIGVDIGEDEAKARTFIDELGVTFEQFVDASGELTDALGTASLPVTLVLAADGTVATEHLGPMTVDDLEAAIDGAGG